MGIDRRAFLAGAAAAIAAPEVRAAGSSFTVTDMIGRHVALVGRPSRIVLLEARDVLTMGVIHPEPAKLIVGWAAVDRIDSDALRQAYEHQAGHSIAVVGKLEPGSVSLEAVIALQPDLVVASAYADGGDDLFVQRLESLGIPVVFGSAVTNGDDKGHGDDLSNLMRFWGRILGREEQAEVYLSFFADRLSAVGRCLEGAEPVKTYLEVQSTYADCCWAAGKIVWGTLLAQGGGRSLDAVTSPWFQQISAEQLIAEAPGLYIASGGGFSIKIRPAIAPGLPVETARQGLRLLAERPALSILEMVRQKRVHGIWTGLVTVPPLNILFVELVAKWAHPDRCAQIDPAGTLAALNERFLTIGIETPCWVSLRDDQL
ncbi:iron complex transport system substrate-binding protein [Aureimonas pseudogalii]|uniref:Iron complex transport system substrate-binding protein n=2 Tax=Aureimonas pseudogalii TaxID=1744844 RepID=A0A7W6H7Y6_9HYPH|nr:iron complex transport system substrate-binding protein [Aureimonas pseudogalii]